MTALRRREPTATCWNCDAEETSGLRPISLSAPAGRRSVLPLCRICYTSYYLPLAHEVRTLQMGPANSGTVLIADDDPDIRAFSSRRGRTGA